MKRKKKPAARAAARPALLPLGALAAGFGLAFGSAHAQTTAPEDSKETTLAPIKVKAQAEATGKDSVRATETRIGKGQQELRDIPQSITVVTERLIDDRNLDTMKDALRNTAGITFQAAEGQEEDVRLRGFALQSTGDIFLDGMRDPGFYDRDSFNWDRLEVIRGSASMLFGRGSTGGAVNQVNKQPMLINQNELSMTLGNGSYVRGTADFNLKTGDDSAVRLNALVNEADNGGNRVDKQGIAPTFRWGIGTRDEFSVGLYHLQYKNGINYGFPWLQNQVSEAFKPDAYYGAASDITAGGTTYGTATHVHRFAADSELRTVLRIARYERDQRASAIRFAAAAQQPGGVAVSPATIGAGTVLTRGSQNKIQDMESVYLQSDYSGGFEAFGMKHAVLSGIDLAAGSHPAYSIVGGPVAEKELLGAPVASLFAGEAEAISIAPDPATGRRTLSLGADLRARRRSGPALARPARGPAPAPALGSAPAPVPATAGALARARGRGVVKRPGGRRRQGPRSSPGRRDFWAAGGCRRSRPRRGGARRGCGRSRGSGRRP